MKRFRSLSVFFVVLAAAMMMYTVSSFAASDGAAAQIMMNGEYMEFQQDSLPKNVDGRIMVPYRAIFEYLGLDVGYDESTKEITGKTDDFTLSMKSGNPVITLTHDDGKVETKTMDVAPYISSGRTFVPTRFVSEMLGYSVGWDSDEKTVIIIDPDSLVANANEDFSTLMKLQDLNSDSGKSYEVTGVIASDIKFNGSADDETAMVGSISGVVSDADEDLSMSLIIGKDKEKSKLDAKMKFDGETGDIYFQADGISEEGQWIKLNLATLTDSSDIDLNSIVNQANAANIDLRKLLSSLIDSFSDEYSVDSYDEMRGLYNMLKTVIGDGAFKKSGNAYTASFSQTLDETKFAGDIEIDVDSSDKATGYSMNISISDGTESVTFNIKGEALSTDAAVHMGLDSGTDVNIRVQLDMKPTDKKADLSIPEGESVADYNNLMKYVIKDLGGF
jgi:hypothetical protein